MLTSKSSPNDQDIDVEVVCVGSIGASPVTVLLKVGLQDPLGLRFLANGTHDDCCMCWFIEKSECDVKWRRLACLPILLDRGHGHLNNLSTATTSTPGRPQLATTRATYPAGIHENVKSDHRDQWRPILGLCVCEYHAPHDRFRHGNNSIWRGLGAGKPFDEAESGNIERGSRSNKG